MEIKETITSKDILKNLLEDNHHINLIAYPQKSMYELSPEIMEQTIDPSSSEFPIELSFQPEFLDFGFWYFLINLSGITQISSMPLKVKNEGITEITITDISTNIGIVKVIYKTNTPIVIQPNDYIQLTINHVPEYYGHNEVYILVKLNNDKGYFYKIISYVVDNKFMIRPLLMKTNDLKNTESIPLYVKNPYKEKSLVIKSIQPFDKLIRVKINSKEDSSMCCSSESIAIIPPSQEMLVLTIEYTPHIVETIITHLGINLDINSTIYLPILIKIVDKPIFNPEMVNFGTIIPMKIPYRIMISVSNYHEPVLITEIRFNKTNDFVFHVFDTSQKFIVIPKSNKPIVFGYIGFYSNIPGIYETKFFLFTNTSRIIKLTFTGKVTDTIPVFNIEDLNINISGKPPNENIVHEIVFKDEENLYPNVISSETNEPAIGIKSPCNNLFHNCSLNNYSPKIIYQPGFDKMYPLKRDISLFVTDNIFHIPLTIYNNTLICYYTQYDDQYAPNIKKNSCDMIGKIDLGSFSSDGKTMDLYLTHNNPVAINVSSLRLIHENEFCCFEVLTMNNEATKETIKNSDKGKIAFFDSNDILIIQPGSIVIIRFYISTKNCTKELLTKPLDGDSFTNALMFNINQAIIEIKIAYNYYSGDFSFSPSRMRFEPGFPGTVQTKELWAISSFKIPLKIIRIETTDKRIQFKKTIDQIKENSKSEIGLVKFVPGNTPEEGRFEQLKNKILSWTKNTISFSELKLWREIEMMWEGISNIGGMQIDSEVQISTDIIQNLRLPIKAELSRPILSQDNELNFELIQNGTNKEMSIQIYNPSSNPMKVQLFSSNPSNGNYKTPLPLSLYPQEKDCIENYTIWIKRYEISMQQIRTNRRLTKYISFGDFADEYCCYMGKYNSSILYSSKYEEITDNDLSGTLMNHCYSKSVTSYGLENSVKKDPETYTNKGIWSLIFKKNQKRGREPSSTNIENFFFTRKFSDNNFIIEPFSYLNVGPIVYSPKTVGEHYEMIFIKNNLTVLYPIKLRGESGVGTLEFIEETNPLLKFNRLITVICKEHAKLRNPSQSTELDLRLTKAEIIIESNKTNYNETIWENLLNKFSKLEIYTLRTRKTHHRIFTVRNIGNMPLIINGISVDGRGCSAYGLTIDNCGGFRLEPHQVYKVNFTYVTSFAVSSVKHSLIFDTESGIQTFDLIIRLPFNVLSALQRIPVFEE